MKQTTGAYQRTEPSPRDGFLESGAVGICALATRRDVIADGVSVAGDGHGGVRFQQISSQFVAKLSDTNLHGFHDHSLRTLAYTSVPLVVFIANEKPHISEVRCGAFGKAKYGEMIMPLAQARIRR